MAVNIKSTGGVGLKNALRQLQAKIGNGAHVRVGFLEGTEEDHKPTATIAAYNEFGTATSPPRPFMRTAVAKNKDNYGRLLGSALVASGYSVNQALAECGFKIEDQIREEITTLREPADSPVTDLLKSRFPVRDRMTTDDVWKAMRDVENGKTAATSKPLIWTGQMVKSVNSDVKGGSDGS